VPTGSAVTSVRTGIVQRTLGEGPSLSELFDTGNQERPSPNDWIPESDIYVYDDKVIIDIEDAQWATFTDTNSMDPVIDLGANAIEVVPKSPGQIQVGDIVSYESKYASGTIIHRVVEVGQDSEGWFAIMKGDNNPTPDPGRIRFEQIRRVVIGILY
jgi:hypothetical protein